MYMQILSTQPAASYAPPPFQRRWPSVMGSPPPSTLGTHSNSTMGSPPPNPWNSSTMGSPPLNPPALYTPPNRYQHSDGQQSSSVQNWCNPYQPTQDDELKLCDNAYCNVVFTIFTNNIHQYLYYSLKTNISLVAFMMIYIVWKPKLCIANIHLNSLNPRPNSFTLQSQ